MAGNKCAYFNCGATARKDFVKLFRFPKDEKRYLKWIENSGMYRYKI